MLNVFFPSVSIIMRSSVTLEYKQVLVRKHSPGKKTFGICGFNTRMTENSLRRKTAKGHLTQHIKNNILM